ncbi:MAG: hypothetical protein KZQ83_14755 [gamma proteobacterium symbiont of Taylorina sp.]|nr:hypothetical protein [gamma proteobacterium symbiont of Taylorina sp.]
MDKHTLTIIVAFLMRQLPEFQRYLETKGIDPEKTEAESISMIESLTEFMQRPMKFHPKKELIQSKTVYSCNGEDNFTDCWEDIQHELSENNPVGSIVSVSKGISVLKLHQDFIYAGEIIDSMKERAYEEFDDYADGYLEDIKESDREQLKQLIITWFNNNAKQPTFYNVKDIEDIEEIEVKVGEDIDELGLIDFGI